MPSGTDFKLRHYLGCQPVDRLTQRAVRIRLRHPPCSLYCLATIRRQHVIRACRAFSATREGTGEGESLGSAADLRPILSDGDRAGALSSEHQASRRKPSRITNSSRKLTRVTSPHGISSHLLRDGLLRRPGVTNVLARSVTHVPRTYKGKGPGVRAPRNFHYSPIPCKHSVKPKDQTNSSALGGRSPCSDLHEEFFPPFWR